MKREFAWLNLCDPIVVTGFETIRARSYIGYSTIYI